MRVTMRYGRNGLDLEVPDGVEATVIRKKPMPILAKPQEAMCAAFDSPVGSRTLAQEARGRGSACILICDITRPVPNALVLPPLIEGLMRAGIPVDSVRILVATGLHRPSLRAELRELVGDDWVLRTVRVENHVARNDGDHVYLGMTPGGIPVKLDRRFIEADVRIVVGLVEPHFMAGYSGGRKVILPGIAHQDTIGVLHSTRMLRKKGVANCVLDGNPLHEEQLFVVSRMVGGCLAVNTVIDEERNVSFVNFGRLEESHSAAVSFGRPYFEVPVRRRFRTVVTSAAGYPLDRNYYQTVKGMVAVAEIVEPDGDIFVVSECSEGLGTAEYEASQARLANIGPEAFLSETSAKESAAIDEWETVMQIKAMQSGTVHLAGACLSASQKTLTGVHIVEGSLTDAVLACARRKGDGRVAFIPEGPYVIPRYRPMEN